MSRRHVRHPSCPLRVGGFWSNEQLKVAASAGDLEGFAILDPTLHRVDQPASAEADELGDLAWIRGQFTRNGRWARGGTRVDPGTLVLRHDGGYRSGRHALRGRHFHERE